MSASNLFVSTMPAEGRDVRLGMAVAIVSLLGFAITAPFALIQLAPLPLFIGLYQSTLALCDLITLVLLLGQFAMLRSRKLLFLAAGYLFTATIAVVHGLTFPGLFAPTGLLAAGPQTTAWLYMVWHAGFPVAVILYAMRPPGDLVQARPAQAMLVMGATVLSLVGAVTLLTTVGHTLLPPVMSANRYTGIYAFVVSSVCLLSMAALWVLWRSKPHTVLDVWLMVTLLTWNIDVALSAALNGGRYDLGFYAGRLYGLAAAAFVLVVLLLETTALYARLVSANLSLRQLASRDGLTGMYNRRHFDECLATEIQRSRREGQPLSLQLIDIDYFKQYNDHYGHLKGDACLRLVGASIERVVRRPADVAARFGGEEFAVLLPNTSSTGALDVAAAIRVELANAALAHATHPARRVTVSIGVATATAQDALPAEDLIARADAALYRAKHAGRDAVMV